MTERDLMPFYHTKQSIPRLHDAEMIWKESSEMTESCNVLLKPCRRQVLKCRFPLVGEFLPRDSLQFFCRWEEAQTCAYIPVCLSIDTSIVTRPMKTALNAGVIKVNLNI